MKYYSLAERFKTPTTPHVFDETRESLNVYAEKANEMARQLMESGVNSAAVQEAYMSLYKKDREIFDENRDSMPDLFNVHNKTRFRELKHEAARIEKFLASASSDVKVAKYEDRAFQAYQKHGLSFHNQADAETGIDNVRFRGYDQDRIKFALKIYRELEDRDAGAIYGNKGKGGFGSDNLFNLIFDEIEGYDPTMPEILKDRFEEAALSKGRAALEEFRHSEQYGFLSGSPKSRRRDQNLLSEFAKSENAEIFFKRNKWLRERTWIKKKGVYK